MALKTPQGEFRNYMHNYEPHIFMKNNILADLIDSKVKYSNNIIVSPTR